MNCFLRCSRVYDNWVVTVNAILLGLKMYCYLKSRVTVLLVLVIDSCMDMIFQALNLLGNVFKTKIFLIVAYASVILSQIYPLHLVSLSLLKSHDYENTNTYQIVVMTLSVLVFQLVVKMFMYIVGKVNFNTIGNDALIADQLYDVLTTFISIVFFCMIIQFYSPISNLLDYWGTVILVLVSLTFWLNNWYSRDDCTTVIRPTDVLSSNSSPPVDGRDNLPIVVN
uniref:P25 n=1 Tax=Olivavirus actinidiae TaxID=2024724 RepID=A0A7L9CC68_9CLOS|nr:P25 [Actinidia virus 1]